MPRKIIHLDLDAFFCAVEELQNPALRGKPFAVGGRPDERGVVASCSYAARSQGVRSAMPMRRAVTLCPKLQIISAQHRLYEQVSAQVMARLRGWTPLVEQISIDEAFLDLSDLPEPPETLARRLQAEIRTHLGLPCSLGAATNKLVAKIATDVGKTVRRSSEAPCAITVVPPGEEAAFLSPLPVEALWGVGPKTAQKLNELGIHTISDLSGWPESDLAMRFGKMGHEMYLRARGIDDSPIITEHETKSISQEVTFASDVSNGDVLIHTLRELSETVGRRLRQSELSGATVKLKLRWPDFTTLTRQQTLERPTELGDEIFTATLHLFEHVWQTGKAVRLLGVGVSGLNKPVRQLSLWEKDTEKNRRLQAALDSLWEKFGDEVIHKGQR